MTNLYVDKIKAFLIDCDGTLTDGVYEYHDDGHVSKRFHTRDMYALDRLETLGYRVFIVTGCKDRATKHRMATSKKEIIDTGDRKLPVVESLLEREGWTWENVAFIGDAEIDLECMERASFAACPCDAITEIRDMSHYVSIKDGGRGAVHDIVRYFCVLTKQDWVGQ